MQERRIAKAVAARPASRIPETRLTISAPVRPRIAISHSAARIAPKVSTRHAGIIVTTPAEKMVRPGGRPCRAHARFPAMPGVRRSEPARRLPVRAPRRVRLLSR